MSPLVVIALSLMAFVLAASSDWFETRYVRAVRAWEDASDTIARAAARERAARSSVAMWLVGVVALVAVIEFGWWTILPEGVGLYAGTKFAMR